MKRNNYWVSPSSNGWKVQKEKSERAAGLFETQKRAENYGRKLLVKSGGGELITQSSKGPIRSKDTIDRTDYHPPKDTEN